MKKPLIDVGIIILQVVGYALVLRYMVDPLLDMLLGFDDGRGSWGGTMFGTMVGLGLLTWLSPPWRAPWARTWKRIKNPFVFDIEIDTGSKVKPKNELDRNPLDDD